MTAPERPPTPPPTKHSLVITPLELQAMLHLCGGATRIELQDEEAAWLVEGALRRHSLVPTPSAPLAANTGAVVLAKYPALGTRPDGATHICWPNDAAPVWAYFDGVKHTTMVWVRELRTADSGWKASDVPSYLLQALDD